MERTLKKYQKQAWFIRMCTTIHALPDLKLVTSHQCVNQIKLGHCQMEHCAWVSFFFIKRNQHYFIQFTTYKTYPTFRQYRYLNFPNNVLCKTIFTEISCGIPPDGINTQTIPHVNLFYQDTYNYSCLSGYETNDNITTECLADGSWSVESPTNCTSKL